MEKYKWEYIGNNNKFKLYEKSIIIEYDNSLYFNVRRISDRTQLFRIEFFN